MNDIYSIQNELSDEYFQASFDSWLTQLDRLDYTDVVAYRDVIATYCCV